MVAQPSRTGGQRWSDDFGAGVVFTGGPFHRRSFFWAEIELERWRDEPNELSIIDCFNYYC
jgi:hypothetical protein